MDLFSMWFIIIQYMLAYFLSIYVYYFEYMNMNMNGFFILKSTQNSAILTLSRYRT